MTDLFRPHYHFTPPSMWINDPNGCVFYNGEYHLFYQYHPESTIWGPMHWGHAVSHDLVHWEHLPIALYPDENGMIFSGSAVVDWENSSGFGMDGEAPLIAIYTGHSSKQTQNIAYSTDRGRTWTKYAGNPVIDIGSSQFRDPKVLWHKESHQWIMVTVLADQQKIRFYGSPDLKNWTHLSDFGPAGQTDNEWECPDLMLMNVEGRPDLKKWILKVDVNYSVLGQYFVGHFDGTRFINDNPVDTVLRVDYGRDFYAAQSWNDEPDGRHIWIGWMNNWHYANLIPTSPWRGQFSIPRELRLQESSDVLQLFQEPIAELKGLRQPIFQGSGDLAEVNGQVAALDVNIAHEILVEFEPGTGSEFGIKICTGETEETVIGYDVDSKEIFVDRRRSGDDTFSEKFSGMQRAPLPLEAGRIKMHIFVDTCSVEVFGNDGRAVISDLIFPRSQNLTVELYVVNGNVRLSNFEIWNLNSGENQS